MRLFEILAEDGATGTIKPVAPSALPRTTRNQTKPPKRARHQSGDDTRWQTPPAAPKSPKPPSTQF